MGNFLVHPRCLLTFAQPLSPPICHRVIQKDLTVIVADPASFAAESNQLESAARARCAAAKSARDMNRCSGQAALGIDSNVLLETSPEGRLQKIVVSTDYLRSLDNTKTKVTKQPDGTSKVETLYGDPNPASTFDKITQVGFFVLGYNSGQLNWALDNL